MEGVEVEHTVALRSQVEGVAAVRMVYELKMISKSVKCLVQ